MKQTTRDMDASITLSLASDVIWLIGFDSKPCTPTDKLYSAADKGPGEIQTVMKFWTKNTILVKQPLFQDFEVLELWLLIKPLTMG